MRIMKRSRTGLARQLYVGFTALILFLVGTGLHAQQTQVRGRLISSILTRHGFEPSSATTRPGPVQFLFYDRTGSKLDLTFSRVTTGPSGTELLERKPNVSKRTKVAHLMQLEAGEYVVKADDLPQWEFRLTVDLSAR